MLDGGGEPVMQTRCGRGVGGAKTVAPTGGGMNPAPCLHAAALSADCGSGVILHRADHIWQSVNIILALMSSCFIWLHKSCRLHAVTGLSGWRNDIIMAP